MLSQKRYICMYDNLTPNPSPKERGEIPYDNKRVTPPLRGGAGGEVETPLSDDLTPRLRPASACVPQCGTTADRSRDFRLRCASADRPAGGQANPSPEERGATDNHDKRVTPPLRGGAGGEVEPPLSDNLTPRLRPASACVPQCGTTADRSRDFRLRCASADRPAGGQANPSPEERGATDNHDKRVTPPLRGGTGGEVEVTHFLPGVIGSPAKVLQTGTQTGSGIEVPLSDDLTPNPSPKEKGETHNHNKRVTPPLRGVTSGGVEDTLSDDLTPNPYPKERGETDNHNKRVTHPLRGGAGGEVETLRGGAGGGVESRHKFYCPEAVMKTRMLPMRRLHIGLLVLLILPAAVRDATAQKTKIDSLERVLAAYVKSGADRVATLLALGNACLPAEPARARLAGEEASAIARKLGDIRGSASALRIIGGSFAALGMHDTALALIERALGMHKAASDERGTADAFFELGLTYSAGRDFVKSLQCFEESLERSRKLGANPDIARVLWQMAGDHEKKGDRTKAVDCLARRLDILEKLDDKSGVARTFWRLGVLYDYMGQTAVAVEYQNKCLEAATKAVNASIEADALNSLGYLSRKTGDYANALSYLERSLQAWERVGEKLAAKKGMAAVWLDMGNVHLYRASFAKALDCFLVSLRLREECGDRTGTASTLLSIGLYHDALGANDSALAYNRRALAIYEESEDKGGIGGVLNNMGTIYQRIGDYRTAFEHFRKALPILEEIGHKEFLSNVLMNIGTYHQNTGANDIALDYYHCALSLKQEIGDKNGVAQTLGNMTAAYGRLGQYTEALDCALRSLRIFEEIGSAELPGAVAGVGTVYCGLGDHSKAMEYAVRAYDMAERQGSKTWMAAASEIMGDVYLNRAMPDSAFEFFRQSYGLHKETGDNAGMANALGRIGIAQYKSGKHDKALENLRRSMGLLEKNRRKDVVPALRAQGDIMLLRGELDAAGLFFDRALEVAGDLGGWYELMLAYDGLSVYHERRGDSGRALAYYKSLSACKDSLFNEEKLRSINELSVRFKSEKQEQAIALLEKDNSLQASELDRRKKELLLRQLESSRLLQRSVLLQKDRELQEVTIDNQRNQLALEKAEKEKRAQMISQLEKENSMQASINAREKNLRNTILVAMGLFVAVGFLGVKRVQAHRTEAELRAESAEYKARNVELQAQVRDAELLRLQAESDRRQRQAQQEFSHRLIESQERERSRIAAELHDQLGQDLAYIRNTILVSLKKEQLGESLAGAAQTAETMLDNVRRIARDLRPFQLDRYGLTNAVTAMVKRVGESCPTRFSAEIDPLDGLFEKEQEINIFRIVQESVNNIVKHSGAENATVRIVRSDDAVEVAVIDDGRGFDGEAPPGFGLNALARRVEMLEGTLKIRSEPGSGTKIMISLPLPPARS